MQGEGGGNPADLFTKQLASRDRIRDLLGLLGCKYRDGRAAATPVLRAGVGTSKGEPLRLAESTTGTMLWHGKRSPQSVEEDVDTPEALPALEGVLPHLHAD